MGGHSRPKPNGQVQYNGAGGTERGLQGIATMLAGLLQQRNEATTRMSDVPSQIASPPIKRVENVDWRRIQSELSETAKDSFYKAKAKRKGRRDTIHTSPLDENDTETTSNLLGA